jgi:hypothetical protein
LNTLVPHGRIQLHPDTLVGFRDLSQRGQCFLGLDGKATGFRCKRDLDGLTIPLIPGDLTTVGSNSEIRDLLLEQSGITDAMLNELPPLARLETLRLTGTRITDDGLKALSRFPNLKTLWLMETEIQGPGLSNLSHTGHLTNLRIQAPQGDAILQYLAALKELKYLAISAPLTDHGMETLATLPKLESLSLVGMDVPRTAIAGLSASSSLTSLRFDGGSISDADIDSIAGLTKVTEITLSQTRVSQSGRDRLAKLRPDVVLIWPRESMMTRSMMGR